MLGSRHDVAYLIMIKFTLRLLKDLDSEFVIGERFVELNVNLYQDSKEGVSQKSERFCKLLFLMESTVLRFPLLTGAR